MSGPAQNVAQNGAEQAQVIAQLQKLLKDLAKCAPHPDKPDHQGPLFLNKAADLEAPSEYDSMLGSLLMESFLGTSFASVAGECAAEAFSSVWNGAETASHIYQDRQRPAYALGQRRMIASNFNGEASKGPAYECMMKAYLADLPERLSIEKFMAHELRRLYALRKHAPMAAPSMAA